MTNYKTNGFKIEKGVKMPTYSTGRTSYPFGDMKVGDSFAVEDGDPSKVRTASSYYGRRNQLKFAVYKTTTGYRCWRVS